MGYVADIINAPARITRSYAEMMLKDVKAEQFARLPSAGGKIIQTNHPAFVFGHLSIYPARICAMLGQQGAAVPNPPKFEELFGNGKPCLDDPKGTIYPPMDIITKHFFSAFDAALAVVGKTPDTDFNKPNPAEGRFKEMCPTVGAAASFLMSTHAMSHLGQVSAWRRIMGLGSAM